jgi:penicillin-binding protein 2
VDEKAQKTRMHVLRGVALLALALLVYRLGSLQIAHWDRFRRQAAASRTQTIWIPACRGTILDRQKRLLAVNEPAYDVVVDKTALAGEDLSKVRAELIAAIQANDAQAEKLRTALDLPPAPGGVVVASDVGLSVVARIQERPRPLPGVRIVERAKRLYPNGSIAAHLLGYVQPIDEEEHDRLSDYYLDTATGALRAEDDGQPDVPPERRQPIYFVDSTVGTKGIEKWCEFQPGIGPILQGLCGRRVLEVNAARNVTGTLSQQAPRPGADVYLAIDLDVQRTAEESLQYVHEHTGKAAAAVVMDVRSGEVLALASRPSFDPNRWIAGWTTEDMRAFQANPCRPELDHATAGVYPPGSIFKIITACAALERAGVTPQTTFECRGVIHVGAAHEPLWCWNHHGHGQMDFLNAIEQSCDVYFYSLVLKAGLTIDDIGACAREFGLGAPTGIELAGEADGRVPTREWYQDTYGVRWSPGDTAQVAIGQSALAVTPLQMVVATAAIANGGNVLRPHLVERISWPDGRHPDIVPQPEVVRHVSVSPEHLRLVQEGMRRVVNGTHGTGKAAAMPEVVVAGKTGSAEPDRVRPTHAWFVCYAPADDPKYACVVLAEEAGSGGKVAAPIARRILRRALGLDPGAFPPLATPHRAPAG